jgi:hypothetical protein
LRTTFGAASRGCAIEFAREKFGEFVRRNALEKWIAKWVMCDLVRVNDARLKQLMVITHVVVMLFGCAFDRVVSLKL